MTTDVIVGSKKHRIGEEGYFYYEPGTDATTIIQAALDYANKERKIILSVIIRRRITGKYGVLRKDRPPKEGK